jgi:uncharacterized protein YuzE
MSKIFKIAYILSHYLFRKKSYLLLNILYLIAEKVTVPDGKHRGGNLMVIPINAKEDRRSWKRYIVLLKGKYLLDTVKRHKECIIIDISREGACIKTPLEKKISRGDSICLEIFTKEATSIVINAAVQWTKKIEHGLLIGIRFETLIDAQAYDIL